MTGLLRAQSLRSANMAQHQGVPVESSSRASWLIIISSSLILPAETNIPLRLTMRFQNFAPDAVKGDLEAYEGCDEQIWGSWQAAEPTYANGYSTVKPASTKECSGSRTIPGRQTPVDWGIWR